jgi:hypothetical protein
MVPHSEVEKLRNFLLILRRYRETDLELLFDAGNYFLPVPEKLVISSHCSLEQSSSSLRLD